jgi:hypothetical protein
VSDFGSQAAAGGTFNNAAVATLAGADVGGSSGSQATGGRGFTGAAAGAAGADTNSPVVGVEDEGRPAGGALVGGGYDSAQAEGGSALGGGGTLVNPKDEAGAPGVNPSGNKMPT